MAILKTPNGTIVGLIPEVQETVLPEQPLAEDAPKKRTRKKNSPVKPETVLESIEVVEG